MPILKEVFVEFPYTQLSRTAFYGSCSKLKLKTKYRITFLTYNLSTEIESVVQQDRIHPDFLTQNSYYRSINYCMLYLLCSPE
ncbi:hypothetical protein E4413_18510 [Leptospira interrogans]|nr:hypothetical protein C5473_12430 [Leptospira interrogans serovar Weerasinghe]KAA1290742.1 hypothetical protein C4X99_10470 [Leptospira interrogans serovar Geyaweera]QCO34920.1 hypothetical protein E4414_19060 [Leptospira interrogans]QCO38919.1 hypothetical protein E4412_18445 [Leptospira interrogans]QCO42661.1 hypothetical protein E4413_18510 [Leptospira interrogans]